MHLQLAMHGDAHGYRTEASAYTTEPELHGTKKVRGTTSKKRRPDNDTYQKAVLFNTQAVTNETLYSNKTPATLQAAPICT